MKNVPALHVHASRSAVPIRGGISCGQCQESLNHFMEAVLEGGQVLTDSPVLLHVEDCPRCSETYIHLLDLMTAPQIEGLQESQVDPAQTPATMDGLLPLWRLQVAACNRLEDLNGCTVGLSVLGMIYHRLGEWEEARALHGLALQMAEEGHGLLCRVMSCTDLGTLALSERRAAEAVQHLSRAYQYAGQLADQASMARVLILLGDAWQIEGNLEEARRMYKEARTLTSAVSDRPASGTWSLYEVVQQRIQAISDVRLRRPACPPSTQLAAYYRGELQGGEALLIAQHLRRCEFCATELAALARRERVGLCERLRTAIEILEATLISPKLEAARVRGESKRERPGLQVYRARELEVLVNQRASHPHRRLRDLSGLIHIEEQEPEGIGEARVELYRGEGLIAVSQVNTRGQFTFKAIETGTYDISLVWGSREIQFREVRVT
jgi:tetratricopeptide (TPR) repeat protein